MKMKTIKTSDGKRVICNEFISKKYVNRKANKYPYSEFTLFLSVRNQAGIGMNITTNCLRINGIDSVSQWRFNRLIDQIIELATINGRTIILAVGHFDKRIVDMFVRYGFDVKEPLHGGDYNQWMSIDISE